MISSSKYNTYVLEPKNWDKLFKVSNKIYESNLVKYCHPNFIAEITTFQNDPLYPQQYYLNNTGQLGGISGIDIKAAAAWNISMGVFPVTVAVIDQGVENHEDFDGRILRGFTPTDSNGHGLPANPGPPQYLESLGHGEACTGIIAASHNNIGIAGIAPCARIYPVNIFNDWYLDIYNNIQYVSFKEDAIDIQLAIDSAWDRGHADVLSNSWGYGFNHPQNTDPYSNNYLPNFDHITAAIGRARTQGRNGLGSIVVFASGNSNQSFSGVAFPANVDGVVTVGAIDNRGNLWNYSSRGPEMDLVAPSGDINLNGNIRTTDRMGTKGYESGNYTSRFGGTSAACPQVSGVAALILSVNPSLTESQVVNILRTTASDMGASGFDNNFGYGLLNAGAALNKALLTISGPNSNCDPTTILAYTITNLPANDSIYWTKSSNITYVSGKNTNNYRVKLSAPGIGWVQATIIPKILPCGSITLPQYTITDPGPNVSILGPIFIAVGQFASYTAIVNCGGSNIGYSWYLKDVTDNLSPVYLGTSYPFILTAVAGNSPGTINPNTPINPKTYILTLTAGGTNGIATNTYTITCNGNASIISAMQMMVSNNNITLSPNPGSDYIQVSITKSQAAPVSIDKTAVSSSTSNSTTSITTYTVRIVNSFGMLMYSTKATGDNFTIPVNSLTDGAYIVEVTDGQNAYSKQFVVKH